MAVADIPGNYDALRKIGRSSHTTSGAYLYNVAPPTSRGTCAGAGRHGAAVDNIVRWTSPG